MRLHPRSALAISVGATIWLAASARPVCGEDAVVVKGGTSGVVDGAGTPADAYVTTKVLSGGLGTVQLQTFRSIDGSLEEIQMLFSINDAVFNNDDEVRVFFDVDHDQSAGAPGTCAAPTSPDRGLSIKRNPVTFAKFTLVNLFGAPTACTDIPVAQRNVTSVGAGWTVEVKVKAADLALNFIPSLMGVHVQAINVGTATGRYPDVPVINVADWAHLKTRHPLNYALVVDHSGSMLRDFAGNHPLAGPERWASAKKATDIFTQLLFALRSLEDANGTPHFNDKVGLATYYWDDNAPPATQDQSVSVKAMAPVKSINPDGYTSSPPAPTTPVFGQHTPIKRGIDRGLAMLGAETGKRIMIMMSDGIHDRPSSNYNQEGYSFPAGTGAADYQINTVALGPDGSVGTQLLQSISTAFGGFGESYTDALQEVELVDAFAENLFSHLYVNRAAVDGTGHFPVNRSEPRLLVMVLWNTLAGGVERGFWIKKPGNVDIRYDALPAGVTYHHHKDLTLGYEVAYYLIEFPGPTGNWQTIKDDGSNAAEVGDNVFALFDPAVYFYPTITQQADGFLLRAVLREDGVPLTTPGSVVVKVSRADEGLGTYLSTAQPNCTFAEPSLPPRERVEPGLPPAPAGSPAGSTAIAPSAAAASTEVLTPHFEKAQALFLKCQKAGLDRSTGAPLPMFDDGTHGDALAGDGVFSLLYDDTEKEGTYTYEFAAAGTGPSGTAFSRIRTLSAHRAVAVDPNGSPLRFVERAREGNLVTVEVYTTPRSRRAEYLGPGHLSEVSFTTSGGTFLTQALDHVNGIYSRVLQYDATRDRPVVTGTVGGEPLPPVRIFKPWELVLPYGGRTFFDSGLGLGDGTALGVRLGYRVTNQLALEAEGGLTFADAQDGTSGRMIQLLVNLRYDVEPLRIGNWVPYATVGAGGAFFRGYGTSDQALLLQAGVGSTFQVNPSFGLRIDARLLQIGDVLGAGSTTNYQVTGGLVWWF